MLCILALPGKSTLTLQMRLMYLHIYLWVDTEHTVKLIKSITLCINNISHRDPSALFETLIPKMQYLKLKEIPTEYIRQNCIHFVTIEIYR